MAKKPTYKELEQKVKTLQQSVEKYRLIVEQTPAITYIASLDEAGTTLYISPQVKEILGFSQTDWLDNPDSWHKQLHPEDRDRVLKEVALSHKNNKKFSSEYRLIAHDGQTVWFYDKARIVYDADGKPLYLQGSMLDITKLKLLENSLYGSQHMLETVLDAIPSAVFWKDRNLFYLGGNRTFLNTIGMNSSEEVVGKSDYDLPWTKDQADSFRKHDKKIMGSGISEFNVIEPYLKADSTQAWAKTNKIPLQDKDGNIIGILGSYEDITEHKKADDELERQRNLFKMILETTPDLLIFKDKNLVYQAANSSFCKFVGKPMEAVIGKTDYDLFPADEAEMYRRDDAKVMKSLKPLIQDEKATGMEDTKWFHVVKTPVLDNDNNLIGILGSVRDITERKKAQKDLFASEERFRKFVEGTDDLVTRVDSNGRFTYINDTSEKILGLSPEECIGLSAFDFIHPDDREKTKAAFAEWIREEVSIITFENRQISKNGQVHYMQWTINQDFDEDGNLTAINSIARDLTELKQIEKELKREKDRFEKYINIAGVILLAMNADQEVILINQKGCEVLGYSRKEIIGKNWFDNFLPKRNIKEVKKVFNELVAGKVEPVEYHENFVLTKTGKERLIAWRNAVLLDERGQFICTVVSGEDITDRKREEEERKKLEAYLQQSVKMKAIATLAGGIAHEFNNALAGTSGNIELLQMNLPDDKNINKYAKQIMDSVHRMAGLTTQLLAYARGGMYQPKTLSLNYLVKETLPVIQHNIASTIQVETDLSADISNVKVDPAQMQMVLSTVLTNASEAMEDNGHIRIITRNEEVDEVFAKTNPDLKPDSYVCLTIEDEGKGMDKETADKVFEPFFTTKFLGRGLGMAAAHGIIKNHGGSISLYSELGKGTVVRIYLPAIEAQAEQAKETEIKAITGTETILVIEDENLVIDVIHQMLEGLGYRTLLAKTGNEAVDIAKTFDGDIDLAILDIVLPDMDGNKLYPLIMKARPNLKVIVCSGYAVDGPAQEILKAGAQDFIQKPFSFKTLSKKLIKVLTATT